ncbi:MAG: FAD:protein FMN transferase [Isosphaeraceae bacterium]
MPSPLRVPRPLMFVLFWAVLMFNGLFVWIVLQPGPATSAAPTNHEPSRPLEGEASRFEFRQTHMGSEFTLILYSADEAKARRGSDAAFARIAQLDAAFSDYQPESELMRLCDQAGGPPVKVSSDLLSILNRSKSMAQRSGGAFDPTVGPVVRLWRRARRTRELPGADLLAKARDFVGIDKMTLDDQAGTVQLARKGMKLDLGGIAKGFASDEALATLRRQGIRQALVAGAGDIAAGDPPPGAKGWTVGIAPLEAPGARPSRFLALSHACVSTSGDAERFVVIDGVRYSHIVDPGTGLGLTRRASVTVVTNDGATSDSLATAATVLGPEQGLKLVESVPNAAALFVIKEGGKTKAIESSRWKTLPTASPKSEKAAAVVPTD